MPPSTTYTLLTLGDSYTIGEGAPIYDSYPYQAVQLLRKAGLPFTAPEIIAKTGWTTDELSEGIAATRLLADYDIVTLLIGVNNQYRGRSSKEYAVQFEQLLGQAIQLAGGQTSRVFVLSIPDWGVSPFAAGRDRTQISREIDVFNGLAQKTAVALGVDFIDITPHSRDIVAASPFVADGLHPSGEQYRYWAERLAEKITTVLPGEARSSGSPQ